MLGGEAKRVFEDAEKMLDELIANGDLEARGIVGFYPANSQGDDIVLWAPGNKEIPVATLHGLRQQVM